MLRPQDNPLEHMVRLAKEAIAAGRNNVPGREQELRNFLGTFNFGGEMVKKAVGFIKEQGADKAYGEFTGKAAGFIDRDLYVVVYQLDGKVLAHGSNAKFVGKDLIDAQDVDGKLYVKERVEMAAKQPSFW